MSNGVNQLPSEVSRELHLQSQESNPKKSDHSKSNIEYGRGLESLDSYHLNKNRNEESYDLTPQNLKTKHLKTKHREMSQTSQKLSTNSKKHSISEYQGSDIKNMAAMVRRAESIEVPFRLPAVGLPMLKAERLLSKNSMKLNPFVIPKNTELMLINNERQRIQEQMTREKIKNVFKVHEKGTFNFRNREGVIREINSILPVEEHPGYNKGLSVKKVTQRYEGLVPTDGDKLNIFEGDPNEIDEKLRQIERDSQLIVQTRSMSQQPESKTLDISKNNKLKANINYLKSQLEIKESRKEFVGQSRELLFKEISIRNKKEETEKLKEFIDTENEKLMEAKNSFKEDSDKFQKYVEELTLKAEQARQETEGLIEIKQQKIKMINSLRDTKADIEREISKVNNELAAALNHKDLIMELAKELSSAMKTKGKKKKNKAISDSDSEFFITTT